MLVDDIAKTLAPAAALEPQAGTLWLKPAVVDVRQMATLMMSDGARLISIVAQQIPEQADIRLDYHWDLDGKLLSITTATKEGQIASIFDLCEAADWAEREIHEYYGIQFTGRECPPLLLRPGEALGLNLRKDEDE